MAEKTDIVIDLTKITKRQMIEWQRGRRKILDDDSADSLALETFDFEELYGQVITAWPFGEINFDTFLDLPYPDSILVDQAVTDTITELAQKK